MKKGRILGKVLRFILFCLSIALMLTGFGNLAEAAPLS